MKKQWHTLQPDPRLQQQLSSALDCHPVIAALLVNRNITSPAEARLFLNTGLNHMRAPFDIRGMDKAVRRIHKALVRREKILVFGDYDVDGITATVTLFEFLKTCGADVACYIPHRIREGYGLHPDHIETAARSAGVSLIITVDCGSTSHRAVAAARSAGIDVIVTDHHEIPSDFPPAVAVVNPKRFDCSAGFEHLAGVGVAFCLLICLRRHLRQTGDCPAGASTNLKGYCDLVALGTIADMVPLVAENRILARAGLEVINRDGRPGVKALVAASGIVPGHVTGDDLAYRLAPRINAAGRMAHAMTAVDLLTTADPHMARQTAAVLNQLNAHRQTTEKEVFDQIHRRIEQSPGLLDHPALVFAGRRWHEGILGIVASRLARKYHRPAVVISTCRGKGKGSARSIPGFNLYDGLKAVKGRLEKFGGHKMAAGLQIAPGNIEPFYRELLAEVARQTGPDDFVPQVKADAELSFSDISNELVDALEGLMPFGQGNREPLFVSRNVRVTASARVGRAHCRMELRQAAAGAGGTLPAIAFNFTPPGGRSEFNRLAYRLRWNRWNGSQSIQLVIEETE